MTEISQWYADHPEVWVEEYYLSDGIKLKMQLNLGNEIVRRVTYFELAQSNLDIMISILDSMLDQLVKHDQEIAELNASVESTGFKPIEFKR
jgi:hypothetical protein